MGAENVPSIWTPVSALLCLVCLALTWRQVRRFDDLPTRFAILAVWLRLSIAAFPAFAEPLVGPMSVAAIFSILVALTALALVDLRLYRLRYAAPIYGLIGVMILSGLINGLYGDMADFVVRYLYMVSLAILLYRAIRLFGVDPVLRGLLCALSPVIVLQFASIPFGIVKIGEEDGSLSFIATYFHEGPYSYLALGFLVVASLVRWRSQGFGVLVVGVGLASIFLANYRTTVLGALPILAVTVAIAARDRTPGPLKPLLVALALVAAVGALLFYDVILPERFADIGRLGHVATLAFEPPVIFSREDREFFNYRVFLWSNYLSRYFDADLVTTLIGHGPVSWKYAGLAKTIYAHNTLVSWLYQFGMVGLMAMSLTLLYNLWLAATGHDREFALRLVACIAGFYVLNFAGEPLYAIEGVLIHGILFGVAWGARAPAGAPSPLPAPVIGGLVRQG
jgi:hypothetical protein